MPRIAPLDPARIPAETAAHLDVTRGLFGGTPNAFVTAAHSPAALAALNGMFTALGGSSLGAARADQLGIAVAQTNGAGYCLAVNTALGGMHGLDAAALSSAKRAAAPDPKTTALLRLAVTIHDERGQISDATLAAARAAGISDAEIVEVVAHVALSVFTNYLNNVAETEIDFPVVALDPRGLNVSTFRIAGLWRYPVKSLAGEPLTEALLTPEGIPGDRIVHVRGPEGVRTSRRQHRMLGLRGTLDPAGRPLINGIPWQSDEAAGLVREAAGPDSWLEGYEGVERFDILPLLVATDGAVAAFGRDIRRLRPNILIGGVEGMMEREWEGAELHVGEAIIRLDSLRARCPMTTVDPDTLERDPAVLKDIGRRFGGRLALNAEVLRPGQIAIGDRVQLRSR